MNHPSIDNLTDQLSVNDLRAYQAGQLSGPARHRVERLLLENPFYADALDGLDALQQVGGSLKTQTRDLHAALQERIHESATPRRLMPLWVTSLVASVLLVLSVAIYLIFTAHNPAKKAAPVAAVQFEPGTVLLDPKDLGTLADGQAIAGHSGPHRSPAPVAKPLRKARRTSISSIEVEEVPAVVSTHRPEPVTEERDPLPRVGVDIRYRHVNTERAFNDWPPSATTISRW